jgi:hypothetical protein
MLRKPDLIDIILASTRRSIITGVLLILMGFLVSYLPKMVVSLGWPSTSGVITSHQIQAKKIQEYDGDFYEEIHVHIRYEYVVEGVTYASSSISAIEMPFYPPEIAERYPIDKDVVVYYNPKDPAEALLEPGFADLFKAFNVFSFLLFVAGIYFIRSGIKERRKQIRLMKFSEEQR